MRCPSFLLLVLLSLAPRAMAATPPDIDILIPPEPGKELRWFGNYVDAVDEARIRNCPVVVVISDDQSAGFRSVSERMYLTPEFPKVADQFVLLIAFAGDSHASEQKKIDSREVEWCGLFHVPCDEHRRNDVELRRRFVTQSFRNPMHIFMDPKGEELHRLDGESVLQAEFAEALGVAQEKLGGEPLTLTSYRKRLLEIKKLVDARDKKGHSRVIGSLHAMAEKKGVSEVWKEYYADLVDSLLREGDELLYRVDDLIRGDKVKEATALLKSIQKNFRGHPPAEAAKATLKKLKDGSAVRRWARTGAPRGAGIPTPR